MPPFDPQAGAFSSPHKLNQTLKRPRIQKNSFLRLYIPQKKYFTIPMSPFFILRKDKKKGSSGFTPNESNQNAEGACVKRLSEQAALKAARRQTEPIPKAFSPKKGLTFVMI